MMKLKLSALDLVPVSTVMNARESLAASTKLARALERLGYHRYWVAEHHGAPGLASSSPAVLIAHLAAATSTLRVGSGGVMLLNHAPLAIAEQFATLEALYPGRIDLGLGRASGTDRITARALGRSVDPDDFPRVVDELLSYMEGTGPACAVPVNESSPDVWLLGSSRFSARLAGLLGRPFAFGHHFSDDDTLSALDLYRSSFRPSEFLGEPYAMVTVAVICADTDEEARLQAAPSRVAILQIHNGIFKKLPTPEEAMLCPFTPGERATVDALTSADIIGSPDTARTGLVDLQELTCAEEFMITSYIGDPKARLRSYELLKAAFPDGA